MQRTSSPPAFDPMAAELCCRRAASDPSAAGDDASVVLDRIGSELAALRAMALDLQDSLGPTLAAAAGDDVVLRAGQGLDLLAQSLDGLSVFVGALDWGDPRPARFDAVGAASRVRLEGLSSRLAGRPAPKPPEGGCGDVDLF